MISANARSELMMMFAGIQRPSVRMGAPGEGQIGESRQWLTGIIHRLGLALMVVAMVLPVASCGRKAAPQPVEDGFYPHSYPTYVFPAPKAPPQPQVEEENGDEPEPAIAVPAPEASDFHDLKRPDGGDAQGKTRQ